MIEEAASLFFLVGGSAAKHFIIVGGLVPPLLVPAALDEHLGSADIDFCLSMAITEGSTGFRWRKREGVAGLPILLDFLAPGDEDRTPLADGTQEVEDETAADNMGPELRPFPLRAGRLIDEDAISTTIEGVRLVYRSGARADVAIRHAGPVGFLAAKADALEKRDDTKDGYDVSWWCLNARATPEEVADLVVARPAFANDLFPESVSQLQSAFKAPDYPGPDGYARSCYPRPAAGEDEFERARNAAYATVSEVVEQLRSRLWT